MEQHAMMSDLRRRFEELEEVVRFQSKQLNKELYSAVRRAIQANDLKNSGERNTVENKAELIEAIQAKATREEFNSFQAQKANKIDVETCFRWVDLLHKMVNQIMLLLTIKFKSELEQVGGESSNSKQNRKVQLLNQSLIIQKWVESFDSKNINDFFYQEDN